MKTKHLKILGKVQGVFYRASAKKKAEELEISGWIKNASDGSVEAMITGSDQQISNYIQWCKSGPDKANVEDVQVTDQELEQFHSFKIKR